MSYLQDSRVDTRDYKNRQDVERNSKFSTEEALQCLHGGLQQVRAEVQRGVTRTEYKYSITSSKLIVY